MPPHLALASAGVSATQAAEAAAKQRQVEVRPGPPPDSTTGLQLLHVIRQSFLLQGQHGADLVQEAPKSHSKTRTVRSMLVSLPRLQISVKANDLNTDLLGEGFWTDENEVDFFRSSASSTVSLHTIH